jgi:hypothetical protein
MKKLFMFLGVLAAAGLIMSCDLNKDDPPPVDGLDANGTDWTNYQTAGSYSIMVRNNANVDLIAFKNTLSEATKLGGVHKGGGTHGFKLNQTLFNANSDFSLIFLTTDQYEANKGNLGSQIQKPFTRLFAVYNATGTNEIPFEISGSLGGNNKLIIQNMTGFDVEFREDSPRGITLGYATHESNNTTLYMNNANYFIYPVFKKYNAVRDEVLTIYPRAPDGIPIGDEFSFAGEDERSINVANYQGNTLLTSGAAFLVVHNGSANGITVYKGNAVQKTVSGISTINSGETRTFTILMDELGGNTYEPSKTISGWKIVNQGVRELPIPVTTLDSDYRYTVEVSGNWNASTQAVAAPVKGTAKVTDFSNQN